MDTVVSQSRIFGSLSARLVLSESHISSSARVRGPDILHNAIVSEYVTFYQINKFFLDMLFFITNKMGPRAGLSPRGVVWRPLCCRTTSAAGVIVA